VQPRSFGEETGTRKGREEGENRSVRTLTPQQNSGGGSQQQRSGEAATASGDRGAVAAGFAQLVFARRGRRLRVEEIKGRGGGFIGAAKEP
jgi:hypothetical protein